MIKTFYDLLEGKEDKIAIFYKDEKISYKQLRYRIDKRCNELKNIVSKKNKIIIKVSNNIKTIIDIYAIDKLGGVIIPIDSLATEKEIKEIIDDVKADIIISEDGIKRITNEKSNLPKDAQLFIQIGGVTLFKGQVYEHNDENRYTSEVLVRARKYGMCPFEYGGSTQNYADMVFDGVLVISAYRDLIIPEACPDLPYNEEAKVLMEQAIAEQEAKKTVMIGHGDE